jgi:putative ABC transport system permease protein
MEGRAAICVLGHTVRRQLFPIDDPIGKTIRIDGRSFRVVGVLKPIGLAGGTGSALVGRDLNLDIHLPFTTAEIAFGDLTMRRSAGSRDNTEIEISEIYVEMPELETVLTGSQILERIIDVDHKESKDVAIIVPYELLENAKDVARTWRRVMVAIAAVSLLVGGIGIMNIMLASVTERIREIGIRRALGATRQHIIWQFLVETGVLSMLGGLLGIAVGVAGALALGQIEPDRFPTHITSWSIIVSFIVACSVGLIFGIYPANVAAQQDPIVALRHD